jgi:hypothetical protein
MPRKRTGTLVRPGADGLWCGRVTNEHDHGTQTKPLYSLGTADRARALRRLAETAALVEAGADVDAALGPAGAEERVRDYPEAWLVRREAQGLTKATNERGTPPRDRDDAPRGLALAPTRFQHAMHLAKHSDPKVHARYVMGTTAMRTIPPEALPALHTGPLPESRRDTAPVFSVSL